MANKVTGKTDTTGALSTAPMSPKSLIIVGTIGEGATQATDTIFSITGTKDAASVYGADSVASKMVKILISNGVDNIKGIAMPSGGTLSDTLEKTLTDKTIKVILATDNEAETISDVKTHLATAEDNDMFRYSVFAPSADNTAKQEDLVAFAKTISDDRIFIPGPSLLDNNGNSVDPQIAAAGLASAIMTETGDPALPMNGVNLRGFNGVSRIMLKSEMDALANAGVTALYPDGNTPAIYRLVTSALTEDGIADAVWQEGTTRFIADYVLESNESLLRANYKRTKNVARILSSIKDDIKLNMEKMNAAEIIENWDPTTLTVVKDPMDNYGAIVDYEFDVVTPLYTITINQHLKL
jgi:phage tail sheath gpL-like